MDRQISKYLMLILILCLGLALSFCPETYAKENHSSISDNSTNHIVAGMSETRDSARKITGGLPSDARNQTVRQRSEKTALYYIGMPGYNRYRIPSLIVQEIPEILIHSSEDRKTAAQPGVNPRLSGPTAVIPAAIPAL